MWKDNGEVMLSDSDKFNLRMEALDWLRAEKNASINPKKMWYYSGVTWKPAFLPTTLAILIHHRDLACVREEKELERLPGQERKKWQEFWSDVAALLKKADGN
jgi:hypothetical protein